MHSKTFGLKWLSNERVIYNLGLSYPLGPGLSMGPFPPHTNPQFRSRHISEVKRPGSTITGALPTGVKTAPTLSPGPNAGVCGGGRGFPADSGISRALSQGRIYFRPQSSERGGNHRVQTPFQVKSGGYSSPLKADRKKNQCFRGGKGSI